MFVALASATTTARGVGCGTIVAMTDQQLNERFGIDGRVAFEPGPGGLILARLTAAGASAAVYLHGAHVAAYAPAGQRPVLFMSGCSRFADGQPIRGGVPVCFPWFGKRADDPDAPQHGLARLRRWDVVATRELDDGTVRIELATQVDPFAVVHRVELGAALTMSLIVRNASAGEASYTAALHSYFAVSDIRQVEVTGLEHAAYRQFGAEHRQGEAPIRFEGETDRLYTNTPATCVLHDAGWARRIVVSKEGSRSTVVWNPWVDKARALPDFGDDEWPRMLCIETANIAENAVTLGAGAEHTMAARVEVEQ